LLEFLENKSVDWRFQHRGEIDSPVKLVYVDIDSLSLSAIGNQPWNRAIYSHICEALIKEGKVKAIGIDIVFSEAGLSESVDRKKHYLGNAEFGRFLNKKPPVALAAGYGGWRFADINGHLAERQLPIVATNTRPIAQLEPPEIPAFNYSADPEKKQLYFPPFIGLIDTVDNGTRAVPAWAPSNQQPAYFHLSLELARLYWGLPPGSIKVDGDSIKFMRGPNDVQAVVPLHRGQFLDVNWFTKWSSSYTSHAEFVAVLAQAENLTSDDPKEKKEAQEYFAQPDFKDAVVLIGPVDALLQDRAPTSLDESPVPKVSLHGNLLKTIVSGLYLKYLPAWRGVAWADHAITFGLAAIVTILAVAGGARALFAKIMAVLAMAIYGMIAFKVFDVGHLLLPFVAPLGAAFTTSFAGLTWQIIDEQKSKGRIKGMFGTYISPQLVEQMVDSGEDPKLGGHVDEITAYFSDIQSFSSFSELLTPEQLVDLMNEYLTACTDIVQAQGGTLDKYIGDAVVAMFGAPIPLPDHAYRACVATQLVHLKLGELRAKWTAEGDKWPEIVKKMQSRIGINSGEATIGNMGSRTRFNYTMMGDNVNLAARMESGAKSWGAYTMCTEKTKTDCEKHGDRVVFRSLSKLVVKGRSKPVPVYEIVGLKENVTQQTRDCIGVFEQALAKYYARDWDGALKLFAQSRELEFNVPGKTPGVVSNPSIVYIEHVVPERIAKPPPADWDGRYEMKEK
jgi:adenylate cyclase